MPPDTDTPGAPADDELKIILLGDSAVGKSKLIERFLLDDFKPHTLSTYALTLYRHTAQHPATGAPLKVSFWDTAGQERFNTMHASYYHQAHACILVFDVSRKVTYKNLDTWYDELTRHRGHKIPVVLVGNKVDVDPARAKKSYGFLNRRRDERKAAGGIATAEDANMPIYFVSASDGTNVVRVFKDAILRAVRFKESGGDPDNFVDEVLRFIQEEESRAGGLFAANDFDEDDGGGGGGSD